MKSPGIQRTQVAGMNMHHKQYSLEHFLESMRHNGYRSIAFWGGVPHFALDELHYQDCTALRRRFSEYELDCVCFTTPALLPGNQFAIGGREAAEHTFRYFAKGIRAAAELGCKLMIANSGYGLRQEPRGEAWKRAREMLCRVAEEGAKFGIVLTMESLRPQETNLCYNLVETRRMLQEANHPNLKAMVDTCAMAVSGESLWDWFEAFDGQIANLHFIDASPIGHLAWGDGILPLADMLRCLNHYGYTGPLGLEITDSRYYARPEEADQQTMRVLKRYFVDERGGN